MKREDILSCLERINVPEEFKFLYLRQGNFSYRYEDEVRFISLGCGFPLSKENTIQGLGLNICFHDLEKFLDPSYKGMKRTENPSHMTTYMHRQITSQSLGEGFFDKFPFEILSEVTLNEFKQMLERFLIEDALPFFDYWSDIRSLLPFIETSDITVIAEVLRSRVIEKKMIIWKLCSHPSYNDFVEKRKAIIENALKSQPDNSSYLSVLKDIKAMEVKLEKVQPLYEWDESFLNVKTFKGINPKILNKAPF